MSRRSPRDIGTHAESAVVRYLREHGFPQAERRSLRGRDDAGDITGTPGVAWQVKGGTRADRASDVLIGDWLADTEQQRQRAGVDVAVLVTTRHWIGEANCHRWSAWLPSSRFAALTYVASAAPDDAPSCVVRTTLGEVTTLLRWAGYGDPAVSVDAPAMREPE